MNDGITYPSADEVACPYCGQRPGQPCVVRRTGYPASVTHINRWYALKDRMPWAEHDYGDGYVARKWTPYGTSIAVLWQQMRRAAIGLVGASVTLESDDYDGEPTLVVSGRKAKH